MGTNGWNFVASRNEGKPHAFIKRERHFARIAPQPLSTLFAAPISGKLDNGRSCSLSSNFGQRPHDPQPIHRIARRHGLWEPIGPLVKQGANPNVFALLIKSTHVARMVRLIYVDGT